MAQDVLEEPAPRLADDSVRRLVAEHWGLTDLDVRPLSSERDLNVLVGTGHVLKVSNPAEDPALVEMEVAALEHASVTDPDLPVPRGVRLLDGSDVATIADDTGRPCLARLITTVPGTPLEGQVITEDLAEQVGAATARTARALQGFFHPAAGSRVLDWDVRRLPAVAEKAGLAADDPLRPVVDRVAASLDRLTALPSQVHHADVTLTNLLATDGRITGVIDVGDLHHTADVADLAVALTSVLRNTSEAQVCTPWELAGAALRGYQRLRPLSYDEVDVLGELVLSRLVLGTVISRGRALAHPDNTAYITQYDDANARTTTELAQLSPADLAERLHRLAGTRVAPREGLAERRAAVMGGPVAPLFYEHPLEIVSGEGAWLTDAAGRRHLDAYNNVAVVGHADPTVTQRVARQLGRLNTHSRYLHPEVVELAERLAASIPDELDTVLFTTSGTEANEVAWRLATEWTGGSGALIVEHGYHGSTRWMADLSSNEWPPGHRPEAVGTFRAPIAPSDLSAAATSEQVQASARALADRGHRPALLLADSGFTSEGVHDAPASYFEGLRAGAHAAGALYLADEVQVGYGRTGPALWRFAQSGVVPDLVTVGKPMGAGYPMGAVVARREVVDRFAERYEYFSTFAATPAAAAAGNAVLDVLADRRLPERALVTGAYLQERLRGLASSYDLLGEVRGTGLVVGVDVLGGRDTAKALLEALVREGALAGLTGRRGDVLKVRPPLVWDETHVDHFVGCLTRALDSLRA
ncbi:4-aminobutyrate aminotransferase-like enzyme/Ser/Thr protein kinase RdoA (MazF antagonist) [Nocardioides sp. BE266]|uniref:aminotransferase class III-fold pyridoxal phosphate-dependent enzyme n=1 Tax=Nocardioides sp. BE266 TaxID=2817725 RepID=UPI00285E86F2|nr:aminotransferase class III-fold pyridoxal phosphate-dependent enzyme [Nocardioides sp. BE266]MDR7254781.1 4-aminobutyrate aminotransferase-like enzyme/Ser/Thr protein kinase RdoA (MazF antagonist) [Nocardioides sp. BE266]